VLDGNLARKIYEHSHLKGEFQLRSGATSDEYFDKYSFEADPDLLREIAEGLVRLLDSETEAVAGLELGGVPLATAVSLITGLPVLFVRKAPKSYGTKRLAEGGDVSGRRLTVIEDVVTSGGQVIESCAALRALGAEILGVACVIDREAGGRANLLEADLNMSSLFTMAQLKRAASSA
jgi:orotate phosphoribosyltransferase